MGRCLGLRGKTVLCLDHYLDTFNHLVLEDPSWKFAVISAKTGGPLELSLQEIVQTKVGDTGYSIFELPSRFPVQFKDITKKFSREGPVSCPRTMTLLTVTQMDDKANHALYTTREVEACIKTSSQSIKSTAEMRGWSVSAHYEYNFAGKGVCGSILLDLNDQRTPIRAIHTAGFGERVGIGEFLHTETFNQTGDKTLEFVIPNMEIDPKEYAPDGATVLGHVDPSMRVVTPSKTKIRKSLLHGVLPTRTEPAPLHGADERIADLKIKPLIEGVSHRLNPVKPFPRWAVDQAVEDYQNLLLAHCLPVRFPGLLTQTEAIMGTSAPFMDKIDMHTSEGYPWVKMRPEGCSNKSWLFQLSEDKQELLGINPMLQRTLEAKDAMRRRGVIPVSWYTGCLKDARIPIEKVTRPGATRLFEMSAVDLTLAQRSYHLDFYAGFMNNRRACENTVGININGPEWSLLACDLLEQSNHILAGDYSKYGPRLNQDLIFASLNIIKEWARRYWVSFSPEDDLAFDALAHELVHGVLLVDRTAMRMQAGMMSGNAGTVIINSMCNSLMFRIVYLIIMDKFCRKYASLSFFRKFCRLFSNGDDIICAVSGEILPFFNNKTIAECFATFDIKYTNSKKNMEIVPSETIFEVTYLKAEFHCHPTRSGEWLAALDKTSIEDCFQWVWESRVSLQDRTLENCEQSIRLAYGRGEKYFNWLRNLLSRELSLLGISSSFPTWKFLDQQVWEEKLCLFEYSAKN